MGKLVGGAVYVHRDALEQHDPDLLAELCSCADTAGAAFPWNVCKLAPYRQQVSLLHYPRFREDGHPALSAAASVDLDSGETRVRRYAPNGNRPIMHRKELLLDASDADYARFAALTEQEERAGLFSAPSTIGHERGWSRELERRGVMIRGHRVLRNGG
jgi:DNA phosphorothioation-associated putative methyltransferase